MLPEFFRFSLPTKVLYSIGLASRLGEQLREFGPRKAIVITDKVIAKAGLLEKVLNGLKGSNIEPAVVYDDIPPNSELAIVTAAADAGRQAGCDFVLAIGGGSVLDSAKVINLMMVKGGDVRDHMGAQLLRERLLPAVFIPTTAGTGSEVTQFAMISDLRNDVKLPFAEDAFLPEYAILDPEMTVTMPGKVTAATGMDALTHAIETYVSIEASPVADALALQAIELINDNIRQACANPDDLQARGAMLVASFLAAVAFNHSGVGIVHGISHALGGVYHIPHGLANAIILPFSVEHNIKKSAARYARISQIFGEGGYYPVNELSRNISRFDMFFLNQAVDQLSFVDDWLMQQRARTLATKLRILNQQLKGITGMPTNLREAGIQDNLGKLDQLVRTAMEDGAMLFNPEPVTADEVRKIVRQAYQQDMPGIKLSKSELKAGKSVSLAPRLRNIFSDTKHLYDVIGGFFRKVQDHPELGPKLLASGLKIRFNYDSPDGSIALDGTTQDKGKQILFGDDARAIKVDVEFTLPSDLAHYFWHGKVNLVQALSKRDITPKGNVPMAMRLLPLIEPLYDMYPRHLREIGMGKVAL